MSSVALLSGPWTKGWSRGSLDNDNHPPWGPEQCQGEEMLHILPET